MYTIRSINPEDNQALAKVIRDVLIEHKVPKVGTAYEDKALDDMFKTYKKNQSCYFALEHEGRIIGGAGISPLENGPADTAELQKMYFLEEARGKGLGSKMMKTCLDFAKDQGFDFVYIETMPYMKDAQRMYKKFGFEYIDKPMGDTGHHACPIWMLKKI